MGNWNGILGEGATAETVLDWVNESRRQRKRLQEQASDGEVLFDSYRAALDWARCHPGRAIVRNPGTNGFMVKVKRTAKRARNPSDARESKPIQTRPTHSVASEFGSFPDPRNSRSDVIDFRNDLSPETVMEACRSGIYPSPNGYCEHPWYSPLLRAVLFFDELHVSRSLARARRTLPFRLTIDVDFLGVIAGCAQTPRARQDGWTWLQPELVDAYVRLHELGHAHSVEAWAGEELVGGVVGVDMGGAFAALSMFHLRPNASKLAVLHLADHLRSRGLGWMDIQEMSPHMRVMGARELLRTSFMDLLRQEQARSRVLFPTVVPERMQRKGVPMSAPSKSPPPAVGH